MITEGEIGKDEITVVEAARRLNVMLDRAYSLIWVGRLRARKVNNRWRVDADSVAKRLQAVNSREH